jgi:hypothetical protein
VVRRDERNVAQFEEQLMAKKPDIVQVKNPRTGHYVKIDRSAGKIIDHKKSEGAYKDVPIARKSSKK